MRKKLRVGLLLDNYNVSAWTMKMLQNIINSDFAEICLVVINANENKKKTKNKLYLKLIKKRGQIFHLLIRSILEFMYRFFIERNTYLPDATKQINCESLLELFPLIKARTIRKKWVDYFCENDIEKIHEHNIDILVRCGFGILRGEILKVAKYGVWSFHHGDNFCNRGGPAGFWESMESWPETGSMLQILTEDLDNGAVIYRSYSCTNNMSVSDNKNNYFWKSLSFMTRKMEELYRDGEEKFFKKVEYENRHPIFYSKRLYTKPTNFEYAKLILNKIKEKAILLCKRKIFMEQWVLMFDIKSDFSLSLYRYKKLLPPKDRFWADPHVFYKNNKYFVFIEEYIYDLKKGHISLITIDENGCCSKPEIILDKPYHLSYPFIFEYNNCAYMIPESIGNQSIDLYKCVEFPNRWEFQMNLMDNIKAVDSTVFYYNDKWWLFTNIIENEGASSWDELFLFYSSDLFTNNWIPHPQNPIVSDCKSARPAGKLFFENGKLYRPSQNCSNRYGYGFNISEVKVINENIYSETLVSSVLPDWDKSVLGTHTFNRVNSLHIIDAQYRRQKFWFE